MASDTAAPSRRGSSRRGSTCRRSQHLILLEGARNGGGHMRACQRSSAAGNASARASSPTGHPAASVRRVVSDAHVAIDAGDRRLRGRHEVAARREAQPSTPTTKLDAPSYWPHVREPVRAPRRATSPCEARAPLAINRQGEATRRQRHVVRCQWKCGPLKRPACAPRRRTRPERSRARSKRVAAVSEA